MSHRPAAVALAVALLVVLAGVPVVVPVVVPVAQGTASARAAFVPAAHPVAGSFLVSLRDGATATSLVDRYGGRVGAVFTEVGHGFLVEGLSEAAARRLAADPAVERVHQDGTARTADTQAGATYGLDRVDQRSLPLDTTYTYDTTASNVTTYVLDTGIRLSHTEFEGRASSGHDFVDDDPEAEDCNGHGTHVAGTIGGRTWGVAKKTRLVAVRVLGCDGSAPDSAGVRGIEWIARNAVRPAVVNASFVFDTPGIGDEAITRLSEAGITFVAAAGNSASDACAVGPARHPAVIAVAATDEQDRRIAFSNHGPCVDVFAPGNGITSASHADDTGSAVLSGTSMAAPHVAGAAALHLSTTPWATPAGVLEHLTDTATTDVVRDPGPGSPNKLLNTRRESYVQVARVVRPGRASRTSRSDESYGQAP
ncbi:S8 family peptidase [Saccharothrix longispora]|uniref:Subtilisin family serine protease n=1 Tax=Saccharothrix longispora TaxID=33920 RepID=A0ABU1PXX1_9PSEU|nr:S8 family peptidase [Saccharothrix longispora]MDR6595296.1 subtilisin family serine protease [Saccharothrix longispora]